MSRPSDPPPEGRLLAAVDDSSTALRALAYALGLAARSHAELLVVHIEEPPPAHFTVGPDVEWWCRDQRAAGEGLREHLGAAAACRLLEVRGQPYPEIVRLARASRADAIVVGASEHGHLLSGSVARRLVRAGVCPVVVVP